MTLDAKNSCNVHARVFQRLLSSAPSLEVNDSEERFVIPLKHRGQGFLKDRTVRVVDTTCITPCTAQPGFPHRGTEHHQFQDWVVLPVCVLIREGHRGILVWLLPKYGRTWRIGSILGRLA